MKERPVLVTGGSGFIGGHLVSAFAEHYETHYTYLSHPVLALAGANGVIADITDCRMISELVEKINPRLILHAAALTNFNQCASHPNHAHKVNVQGSENIAKSAAKVGARLVNFSTDMVFGGTRSFFTEYDTPLPCCTYGKTMLAAEQASACVLDNLLTVRLSLVYGISLTDSKSHAELLANKLLSGEKVSAFANEFRTPIFVKDVVKILMELAFRDDVKGLLHLAGPDRLSRLELGMIVGRVLSLPEDHIVPIASDENGRFLEPRPRDCSLQSLRLSDWWRGRMTATDVGIAVMMQKVQRKNYYIEP
jgi:dTDP-4-dehydrorhamnose reductase